jgi:hypothetical protein
VGALRPLYVLAVNGVSIALIYFLVLATSNSHYINRLFESPPTAGFQITDLGVSSAKGAGNT